MLSPMSDFAPFDKRAVLGRIPIFAQLEPRELDALLGITVTKRLATREVLVRKGDNGSQVYAIMRGRLKVTTAGEDGREAVLRIMGPGEVAGEIALLDGGPRSATIVALEPAEVLVIQRRDLIPFLEKHPRVAIKLLAEVGALVRSISSEYEDILFLNLPSRLAKKLLGLAATYGRTTPEGTRIDLRLSQGELGEMVGTTRESINKQLRGWTEGGVLSMERGFVTIYDRARLQQIAGSSGA